MPWSTAIVILLVAMAAAAGLCVADTHDGHHDHGGAAALDLCLGMIGVALVTAPPIVLLAVGRAPLRSPLLVAPSALEVSEPPPRA